MLVRYTVENYRSFENESVLDLEVYPQDIEDIENHPYIVTINGRYISKLGIVYGHNGAGKSNLINSLDKCIAGDIKGLFDPHFRSETDRSIFTVEFYHYDGTKYILCKYELTLNNQETLIETEVLQYNNVLVFERTRNKVTNTGSLKQLHALTIKNTDTVSSSLKDQTDMTKDTEVEKYCNILRDVLVSPAMSLEIPNDPNAATTMIKHFFNDITKYKVWEFYKQLLKLADVGIEDLSITEELPNKERIDMLEIQNKFDKISKKENKTEHDYLLLAFLTNKLNKKNNSKTQLIDTSNTIMIFSIRENLKKEFEKMESTGTKSYSIHLLTIVLALVQNNLTIHDEFNGIQTELIHMIISLFRNNRFEDVSISNGQFIFSTHDINIMDFRNRELPFIWFVDKENHSSEIFSAKDIEGIDKKNLTTAYLKHEIGARYISKATEIPKKLRDEE